ncbi:MAG TPA: SAM-dependent chlorinase/fluorinase [Longimicrobiales bacterium]|nr:SAM-dependent chlorinase/fluorinase [Longimicrobiales bacterium]
MSDATGLPRITLLTDFGTADGYVAAIRGVIAGLAPHVLVEDASHEVAPGDLGAAAWALGNYWRFYPPGTIHLVVVDPGVGSDRRALAGRIDEQLFVAPDNGVLTRPLLEGADVRVVAVENRALMRETVAATFHGRDLFAPAAAYLARGVPLEDMGPPVSDPVRLPELLPERGPGSIRGSVVHIDRFGNLITNIPGSWLIPGAHVRVGSNDIGPLRSTYADVATGRPLALIGSAGYLEISVRDGSAASRLWQERGSEVVVERMG